VLSLRWSGRISVTRRILAVNIFALVVLAASFFYLDSYRTRLLARWEFESKTQVELITEALKRTPALLTNNGAMQQFAKISMARVRVVDGDGRVVSDSWPTPNAAYGYNDPKGQAWNMIAARVLDRIIDTIVFAPDLRDFTDTSPKHRLTASGTELAYAPDRTPMISAFAPLGDGYVLTTENARAITTTVRQERLRLALIILAVGIFSVLLSLFLARTIVQPLRRLASAAVRVRLGRSRDVTVPRFATRSDEIGMLARALSDMTTTLRARIDATEAFAADVSHELKNPLASLGSAVDSLAVVQQTELKAQLIEIIRGDVRRLDRLISDISGLSRLDAQMSRTPFKRVSLCDLIDDVVHEFRQRAPESDAGIAVSTLVGTIPIVMADKAQLERVVSNLLDNALSFAPQGTCVRVGCNTQDGNCLLWVEDDGVGVPASDRETIFKRFNSFRPEDKAFAQHSGLGLAIVRTIVEAHHGNVVATDHANGSQGARFLVTLPAADAVL
jgi:two-component system sensor histidine kinase ChvG